MKHLKKLWAALVAAAMCLCFSACGEGASTGINADFSAFFGSWANDDVTSDYTLLELDNNAATGCCLRPRTPRLPAC